MRSYLLNGHAGERMGEPVVVKTITTTKPIDGLEPVGTVEGGGPPGNKWDLSQAETFLKAGAAAQESGLIPSGPSKFDFTKALAAMGTGAAVASWGGVTAIVGAIAGLAVYCISFLSKKTDGSSWSSLPQEVRDFGIRYWPEAFKVYLNGLTGGLPETIGAGNLMLLKFWLERDDYVIGFDPSIEGDSSWNRFYNNEPDFIYYYEIGGVPNDPRKNGAAMRKFYSDMAIDYDATMNARIGLPKTGRKPICMKEMKLKYNVPEGWTENPDGSWSPPAQGNLLPMVLGVGAAVGLGVLAWNASKPGRSSAASEL